MMTYLNSFSRRAVWAALLCLSASGSAAGRQQQAAPGVQRDDVVRISAELVQTVVTVFDKEGRFVEGLKPEQFELRVDGQPVKLSAFEWVAAGAGREEKPGADGEGRGARPASGAAASPEGAVSRGRVVVFFVDDLHLSAESLERTRRAILEFVDKQMAPGDQLAVASASGQIGFLQQFTDLPAVLRAAVGRLHHKPYTVHDSENIPMTEYEALQIEQGDKFALEYYASELLKATNFNAGGGVGPPRTAPYGGRPVAGATPGISRDGAERFVKGRAQLILKQSAAVTIGTLSSLESLMRTSGQMPGRKLVFFISDGFYLNDRNTGFGEKLRLITDAASRTGAVIYTMSARGQVSMTDAGSNRADPAGLRSRANVGEITAAQDALATLASETGGRAQFNTDALAPFAKAALDETSNYYLLAWRPAGEEQKGGKFKRVEVGVAGRPDLTVRLPRGFFAGEPGAAAKSPGDATNAAELPARAAAKGPEADFNAALNAYAPKRGLRAQLSLSFVDVPDSGPVLTASTQIATGELGYGAEGRQTAAVDLAGVILDEQGKPAGSFKTRLNVNPLAEGQTADDPGVIYSSRTPLKPGLYQVRVAARDAGSGRVGSDVRWIEIPDLSTRRLTLSSLLLGGQFVGSNQPRPGGGASEQVQFSVDRRFARGSRLNLLAIVYNAARGAGGDKAPQLEAQIRIGRGGQTIVTSPLGKLSVDPASDMARIPYGVDIALKTLPPGRYTLEVIVNDRVAQASASQSTTFDIVPAATAQR